MHPLGRTARRLSAASLLALVLLAAGVVAPDPGPGAAAGGGDNPAHPIPPVGRPGPHSGWWGTSRRWWPGSTRGRCGRCRGRGSSCRTGSPGTRGRRTGRGWCWGISTTTRCTWSTRSGCARAGDRLVLLHSQVDRIGPARLSVVDDRGRIETVQLPVPPSPRSTWPASGSPTASCASRPRCCGAWPTGWSRRQRPSRSPAPGGPPAGWVAGPWPSGEATAPSPGTFPRPSGWTSGRAGSSWSTSAPGRFARSTRPLPTPAGRPAGCSPSAGCGRRGGARARGRRHRARPRGPTAAPARHPGPAC